jgi:DDE superfamily endonuclease/Tc5 transposase-like DNA-binding protein
MDNQGQSPTLSYIQRMADLLVMKHGDASDASHRPVGEWWVQRFLRRHPKLKSKYCRKYDCQHALYENPKLIQAWFDRICKKVMEYGIPTEDIYNFNETRFQMSVAATAKVVTRAEHKRLPVRTQPGNRSWVSVIQGICASGWALPPMIIFEGKVHQSSWYDAGLPGDWRIAVSENGWTNDELGLFWLKNVFHEHTQHHTVGKYWLLLLDGHGSHLTPEFDDFCKENLIIAECMPAHSSHLL